MSDHALFLIRACVSQSLEVKPITRLLSQPEDTLVQKSSCFMTKVILLYDSFMHSVVYWWHFPVTQNNFTWSLAGIFGVCLLCVAVSM